MLVPTRNRPTEVLAGQGWRIRTTRHLPCRGLAEHRAVMLAASSAPFPLFCDDDAWLEPGVVGRLHEAIVDSVRAGRRGRPGLSYLHDHRLAELKPFERWSGRPEPELIEPGLPAWQRWTLHNAANRAHLARRHLRPDERWLAYKIAWVGGCVLYDRAVLDAVGASTSGPTCLPRTAEKMCWRSTGCWRGLAWPASFRPERCIWSRPRPCRTAVRVPPVARPQLIALRAVGEPAVLHPAAADQGVRGGDERSDLVQFGQLRGGTIPARQVAPQPALPRPARQPVLRGARLQQFGGRRAGVMGPTIREPHRLGFGLAGSDSAVALPSPG